MGRGRAAAPGPSAAAALPGAQAAARSAGPQRDPARAAYRDRVGGPAPGVRLWLRGDGVAAAARLAAGRRVGRAASQAAGPAQRGGRDRLVACRRRRLSCACPFGGLLTGPSPVDRARTGSKHHLLVDATGIPLAVALTGGNRNDVTQLIPLLEDLHARPVAGKIGRPRQKPDVVIADRGYDHDKYRRLLRARGIKPLIARRGTEHGSGLGRQRWVVERGFAHLHNCRRLRIRYERYPEIHTALLVLACSILCWRRLKSL